MLNFNNTEASASDYINQFSPIGRKVLQENQIWSKVKRNYYENKRAYYKDKMYTEEDRSKEVITKDSTLNLVDFLLDSKGIFICVQSYENGEIILNLLIKRRFGD